MKHQTARSTRSDTIFPYTTHFRSSRCGGYCDGARRIFEVEVFRRRLHPKEVFGDAAIIADARGRGLTLDAQKIEVGLDELGKIARIADRLKSVAIGAQPRLFIFQDRGEIRNRLDAQ